MIKSEEMSQWVDLFLDQALSDVQAKMLLDSFVVSPDLKDLFVEEVVFSASISGIDSDPGKTVDEVMETIRLGANAPDVLKLVMDDVREVKANVIAAKFEENKRRRQRRRAFVSAVGIGLAACVAVYFTVFYDPYSGPPVAELVRVDDVKWEGERSYSAGEMINSRPVKFESGRIELKFSEGVKVTVEGPAEFRAMTPDLMELTKGVIAAQVLPSGVGFQVKSEHGMVTDYGTVFEVAVEPDKATGVSVFEGNIGFKAPQIAEEQAVAAGFSIKVDADTQHIALEKIDFSKGNARLESLAGVHAAGGQIRIINEENANAPGELKSVQSLAVLPERKGVTLSSEITANIVAPGLHLAEQMDGDGELLQQDDLEVDSYLVQFNPPLGDEEIDYQFRGGLRFDRPIVGVMTHREQISKSNEHFGKMEVEYHNVMRGGLEYADEVTLSEDRKTLLLKWAVTPVMASSRDQIRVIVEAENQTVAIPSEKTGLPEELEAQ